MPRLHRFALVAALSLALAPTAAAQRDVLPERVTLELDLRYQGPIMRGNTRRTVHRDARSLTRCVEGRCTTRPLTQGEFHAFDERWRLFVHLRRRQPHCPGHPGLQRDDYRLEWDDRVHYGTATRMAERWDPYCEAAPRIASWFMAFR